MGCSSTSIRYVALLRLSITASLRGCVVCISLLGAIPCWHGFSVVSPAMFAGPSSGVSVSGSSSVQAMDSTGSGRMGPVSSLGMSLGLVALGSSGFLTFLVSLVVVGVFSSVFFVVLRCLMCSRFFLPAARCFPGRPSRVRRASRIYSSVPGQNKSLRRSHSCVRKGAIKPNNLSGMRHSAGD